MHSTHHQPNFNPTPILRFFLYGGVMVGSCWVETIHPNISDSLYTKALQKKMVGWLLCWRILEQLQCSAELVGTRGALVSTTDAVDAGDDIVDLLTTHQLADALEVAVTAAQEEDLLDDIVLIGSYVDEFRTGAFCFVLNVFCFHNLVCLCLDDGQ